jgi:acetyl-CoA carboxylase carboxyl transferase subunit beta
MLFDGGSIVDMPLRKVLIDPLKFKDTKKYADRIKDARTKTGNEDAILVATGTIKGQKAVIAAFDFGFMGGSMGMALGEALVMAAQVALEKRSALIVIPSSGGARMQEGILSLMQMPRTVIATTQLKEAGVPYITLLTDPTTGGVSASFAMWGDVALAEPGCIIGFAGARVIEATVREKLPDDFQRAEYLLDHGMIDGVVPRSQLPDTLARIMKLLSPQK